MGDRNPHGPHGPGPWRRARRYLNHQRHRLTLAAGGLYPSLDRVPPTPLLCRARWLAPEPVSLADVTLSWDPAAPPAQIHGTGPASRAVRPVGAGGRRFASYAEALAELDPPRLLEDRACYRLTGVTFECGRAAMTFGPGTYFDGINVGEAVAHEFAARHMRGGPGPHLADLPLRARVGDPTDLTRRTANPAISMLTLRRAADGGMTFLLHHRDSALVAHGGGLYQVLPAGVFQPPAGTGAALRDDLDLWPCVVREYGEELLGHPETCGDDAAAFDHGSLPLYRSLSAARGDGSLRCYLLGLGVDPLSLATDILAVSVIDATVFDAVFRDIVAENAEGAILRHGPAGFVFTEGDVERLVTREPMQAAGAAVLSLAWRHRERLTA